MKKILFRIGIVLLVLAAISLGAALFYHWAASSVMDGSQSLYARLFRQRRFFMLLGAGLSITGLVMMVISRVMKAG